MSGAPNDYVTPNTTRAIIPVAKNVTFENRLQTSPSVLGFRTLTEVEAAKVYDYPYVRNTFQTERNLTGGAISTRKWDELNAVLGPRKRVNLIIVRLPTATEARTLEARRGNLGSLKR